MRKKLLATILSIAMVASCIPMPAMAVGQEGENPPATEGIGGSSTQPSGQNANNGDGAGQTQKVVQVGNQQYDSIKAALDANNGDKEITLLGDVTLDNKEISIPGTSTVTINGNGHTITGTIENNGILTLNKVTITSEQATTITNKAGTLTIAADATVKNTGNNGTALDAQAGEVTTNGKIESKNGIAVKLAQANVTVNKGFIEGKTYGVYSKSTTNIGNLNIIGEEYKDEANTKITGETGIYWENPGTLSTSNTNNGAEWNKFFVEGNGDSALEVVCGNVTISGGEFSSKNNVALKIEKSQTNTQNLNVVIEDGEFGIMLGNIFGSTTKSLEIAENLNAPVSEQQVSIRINNGWFYNPIHVGNQQKIIYGGYFYDGLANKPVLAEGKKVIKNGDYGLSSCLACPNKVVPNGNEPESSNHVIVPDVVETNGVDQSAVTAAGGIAVDGAVLNNVAQAYELSDKSKQQLMTKLGVSNLDTINIEQEAVLKVEPKKYQSADENNEVANYVVDISPKVRITAAMMESESIDRKSGDQSASIEEPLEVNEPITVKIPIPKGFVDEKTTKIYLKHTKDDLSNNGQPIQYQEICDIIRDSNGSEYILIDNKHGFSQFTLTKVPTTVASITNSEGVTHYYDNLESAIIDVEDQGTITLEQNIPEETVTVNREVTFTIDKKEFNYKADNIMAGYNLKREVNGNTFIFTYCPPEPDVPIDTVIVEAADNGQVSVDNKKAKEGDKVTVTTMPNENFVVDQIMVTKPGGEPVLTATQTVNQHHFIMPNSPVNVKVTFKAEQPPVGSSFEDVPDDAWFAPAVQYVTSKGIMNGMSETEFAPNTKTNRAMIVTTLYRMENEPAVTASNHFVDVADGQWYTDAIRWASDAGIVSGYDASHFGPTDPITREQLSKILYGYAMSKGYGEAAAISNIDRFDDAVQINSWAKVSMEWANGLGLIQGTSDTMISPQGKALRAQVATILMRFCEDVAK